MMANVNPLCYTVCLILFSAILCASKVQSEVNQPCPSRCTCLWSTMAIHCANQALLEIPSDFPVGMKYLNLQNNNIKVVEENSLVNYTALKFLDLSFNNIEDVHPKAFQNLGNLTMLKMDSNNLSHVPWTALGLPFNLETLSLSNNSIDDMFGSIKQGVVNIQVDGIGNSSKQTETSELLQDINGYNNTTNTFGSQTYQIEKEKSPLPIGFRMQSLLKLDLSDNYITEMSPQLFVVAPSLVSLKLLRNAIGGMNITLELQQESMELLDLSDNIISYITADSFASFPFLSTVNLSGNQLDLRNENWLYHLSQVTDLDLNANPVKVIKTESFTSCTNLQILHLSYCPNLTHIDRSIFEGLSQIQNVSLDHNPKLEFIHAEAFANLPSLRNLDLSFGNLTTLYEDTFRNLTNLQSIGLQGNPWACNCDTKWLIQWLNKTAIDTEIYDIENVICESPLIFAGLAIRDISEHNFTCIQPVIIYNSNTTKVKIAAAIVLDCIVSGDPSPKITWTTPKGKVLTYHPAFLPYISKPKPGDLTYHGDHIWHESEDYHRGLQHEDRVRILSNGSLYIDYVKRHDAGLYTCMVKNHVGNDSVVIELQLNFHIIIETKLMSMFVGFLTALSFFFFGLLTGILRYVGHKCSREERQKRKSVKEIIESLDNYKSDKIDKLSAYKTAKFDQLSAFKSAKVDKLKKYKKVTVTALFQHMHGMREHYSGQMYKVKENCQSQLEKLRDNYGNQVVRLKDYKSNQVDKIKDNYNNQVLKIKDYSSMQVLKLRDQYKLQQQHLMKILEVLDIGNCMNVIEAECIKTESMLFDPDLYIDFDAHPVHIRRNDSDTLSDSDDYRTPGLDTTSPVLSGNSFTVDIPMVTVQKEHKTKSKKKRRHESKEQRASQDSIDGDGNPIPTTSKKHRRRRKPKNELHFIDELYQKALAQRCQLTDEGVQVADVHLHANTEPQRAKELSSEDEVYASAQQSRDHSPENDRIPVAQVSDPTHEAIHQEVPSDFEVVVDKMKNTTNENVSCV